MKKRFSVIDRFYKIIITLLCLILMGTFGYYFIEDHSRWSLLDSLYMTIITLTTVGFGEIHPLSPPGRIFTIFLIVGGFGVLGLALSITAEIIAEGHFSEYLRRNRMQKEIEKLADHFIICGYGRIGSLICEEIAKNNRAFVVVENDEMTAKSAQEKGFLTVQGDATNDDILLAAGIHKAKTLVAVVSSDANNIFITLTAKSMNSNLYIVARTSQEQNEGKFKKAGADKVICPYYIGGLTIAHAILKPNVYDFVQMTINEQVGLKLESIYVKENSTLVNQTLNSCNIRKELGIIILATLRADGTKVANPSFDFMIKPGDNLIALGNVKNLEILDRVAAGLGQI